MKIFGIQVGAKTIPEMAIEEAMLLAQEKNYDQAIAIIQDKALSREPENRRALLHLGICHMLKGDYDRAESILLPIARQRSMDSEKAAAEIALEKVAKLRAGNTND